MDNIILVGFMGTGKSSVGQELARQLGWSFIDTDVEIERETGFAIPEIFRRYGEGHFRRCEQEIIHRVTGGRKQVIATGGGAVISPNNRQRLRSRGVVICLRAAPDLIWTRIREEGTRPLVESREQIERLLAERQPYYQDADLLLDTGQQSPAEIAQLILERLGWKGKSPFSLHLVRVKLPTVGYNIFIQPGIFTSMAAFLPGGLGRSILVISDERVGSLYGGTLNSTLEKSGYKPRLIMVEGGEEAKCLNVVSQLYQEALAAGIDRDCPIIALGGGVVGDLAGFVAATFLRGVPFIQIPTTLLAQVDSSIGGKVGVNLPQGKNLVGSFHQPRVVFTDPVLLQSLPQRELRAGLAEVVKYALVFSPELFALLEAEVPRYLALEPQITAHIIAECCRLKGKVVEEDEQERGGGGGRILLNFGHTIGHALEAAVGYGLIRHGEAVAIGMTAACRLSVELGLLDRGVADRAQLLLERIGLPTGFQGIDIASVSANFAYDKKTRDGKLPFILLQGLGNPVVREDIPGEAIISVL